MEDYQIQVSASAGIVVVVARTERAKVRETGKASLPESWNVSRRFRTRQELLGFIREAEAAGYTVEGKELVD